MGAGEFQPVQAEDDLARRFDMNFAVRGKRLQVCDGSGKTGASRGDVDGADQPGDDVAGVVAIQELAGFGALVEFVELPLGGCAIEVSHALAHNVGAARRQKELKAFDVGAAGELLALAIHPQNAESESGVDRGLSLFRVDTENRKRRLAVAQQAAGVDRAAGVFEVGAAADGVEFPSGNVAQHHTLEDLPVAAADGAQGGRGAWIAIAANFQDCGLRLAEAQHAKVQHARLQFGVEHATNGVALVRPKMQYAFAFARHGVSCRNEVEEWFAVLDGDGVRSIGEESFEHLAQHLRRYGTTLHARPLWAA